MKKQLIVGLLCLTYLVFWCAALHSPFGVNYQNPPNSFHEVDYGEDHHAAIPGKLAIKAFFAKTPVKASINALGTVLLNAAIICLDNEKELLVHQRSALPLGVEDLVILHSALLL
jgi:hypothetical protein